MSDPGFEHVTYRVEWVFMIGTIGDSEGRTWAKDLIEEKRFATKAEAEAYRDTHPGLKLSQWGSWETKNSYGQFAIVRQEVRADQSTPDPRVLALVEAARAAANRLDWCAGLIQNDNARDKAMPWGDELRAALAAWEA